MTTLPRTVCPRCGKEVPVRVSDGKPRNHYPASGGRIWCGREGGER